MSRHVHMVPYVEYLRSPWRMRVVGIEPAESAEFVGNAFLWFVGTDDLDEWFVYGMSSSIDVYLAHKIFDSIDGERVDIALTYGGIEWEPLYDSLIEFADAQNQLVEKMDDTLYEQLRKMSRSEIKEMRIKEEKVAQTRIAKLSDLFDDKN